VKIQLEEVRFTQIVCHVESTERNSLMTVSGVPDPIFKKLMLTHLSVKNSYNEIHENTTKGLVADTRHRQTDRRTDG